MRKYNKTGTSKVGAISKAQKAQSFQNCKSRTVPKKIQRGDPLVTSGFVGYVKIVKNERGDPFALISADRTWPLMLVVLVVSIVRKVAQSE